jgi:Tfp pilus assembly protein PilF
MCRKLAAQLAVLVCAVGCSVAPRAPTAMDALWMDQTFDYEPKLVSVTSASLFALDEALLLELRASPASMAADPAQRKAELLKLLFGSDMKAFASAGGHSTVAMDTWRKRRADCLSLSVLSVALARHLNLPAQIQEVRVPVYYDRRGGVDFLNAHVNVLLRNDRTLDAIGRTFPPGDIVVDFEPQVGSRQRGTALSDRAVLARYLNNMGAEHLAMGEDRLAYANFKAAILADPGHASSYGNLAQLYLRAGQDAKAEALLKHALTLNGTNYLALGELHRLLLAQGRTAEAAAYEQNLLSRRAQDPYYWLGLGLEHLQGARYHPAVDALERALALTSGFAEVHRYLAIAYWQAGMSHKARGQWAALHALESTDPHAARLSAKLKPPDADAFTR